MSKYLSGAPLFANYATVQFKRKTNVMPHKNTLGPCGFPHSKILGIADRFGCQAAALGLTDQDGLNDFCMLLGNKVTNELHRLGFARNLQPYEDRLYRVAPTTFKALATADLLPEAAKLGPYSGPVADDVHLSMALQEFLSSFGNMHTFLKVPVTETLDLLAYIHTVLRLRQFFEDHPNWATELLPQPAAKPHYNRPKRG